jgi:hypothetical protein
LKAAWFSVILAYRLFCHGKEISSVVALDLLHMRRGAQKKLPAARRICEQGNRAIAFCEYVDNRRQCFDDPGALLIKISARKMQSLLLFFQIFLAFSDHYVPCGAFSPPQGHKMRPKQSGFACRACCLF